MARYAPSTSKSDRMIAPISINYPSQLPNTVVGDQTLEAIYAKSSLTVVSFLNLYGEESEDIRERTRWLMLDFDLMKNVQFVDVCVKWQPDVLELYSIRKKDLPCIIYFTQTAEIDRQVRPTLDKYEERVKYLRRNWLKYTMTKPIKVKLSPGLSKCFREQALKIVKSAKVVVLINGSTKKTWCQLCLRAMDILRAHEIKFETYDVLQDEGVFRALRELAEHKINFPHVYVNGRMIGGLPVLTYMLTKGILKKMFEFGVADLAGVLFPEYCVPKKYEFRKYL